jgi:hypothetical protein
MDAYRRVGFREETAIQQLQFDLRDEAGCLLIDAMVVLDHIVQKGNPIKVGITSVIQTKDQNETYWALAHPNPQADFHLRESFTIQL